MSLRNCPNYFPGESSDLQLNVLAQHSRKTNRQQTPKGCAPGRSCSFQGWQLPPGAQLQMVGGMGRVSLESERFPREKGRFEPRISRGHCCQADSRHWFLAGIYFLERTESSVKRSGKGTCLSQGHRSASPAATAVQSPAKENYCTSKGITRHSQRKKYQRQIKQIKTFSQTSSSQNQPTASFTAVITHGQGFVSLIVLGSNSQATAVSLWKDFLKSHQSL